MEDTWLFYRDNYPLLMKTMRKLGQADWFVDGGYVTFIGHYHAGTYLQVYKSHWYNQTLDGVHFEVGIETDVFAKKQVQIDLHIGHRNVFDRVTFNELTIPKMQVVVDGWDNELRFSKTNLTERLNLQWKVTKSKFAEQLTAGFGQIAQLGPIIDEGLSKL